ncbi:MAG: ATP-binding cassette domain-containing protein [Oscillospiraceae bacterium]|nr:ATP-binding cassette domain-containing protein [Oscillospiraceae bacterium]
MYHSETVLEMENVHVRRGCFDLEGIDLSVKKREIFAILGKTGAGKSVLLETAAGFHSPICGSVRLEGRDLCCIPLNERNIGYLYQDYSLFPHLTAGANISFGLRMRRKSRDEIRKRTEEIARLFEISGLLEQYPGTLSGGEQQRVALARALITRPPLLLLDEPFSALDPVTKGKMHDTLLSIRDEFGCAILFVTHNFAEAELLADRVAILIRGRISGVAERSALYSADWNAEARQFLGLEEKEDI